MNILVTLFFKFAISLLHISSTTYVSSLPPFCLFSLITYYGILYQIIPKDSGLKKTFILSHFMSVTIPGIVQLDSYSSKSHMRVQSSL